MNLSFQNFKSLINELKTDLLSKTGVQTSTLYISQIIALVLGVATGVINTRILGPEGYGLFTFFFSFTTFIVLFFRFGFFTSASLLAAQAETKEEEREIIGSSILIALLIGVVYSFTIFTLSFFIDQIFNTNIGWLMRYLSFILTLLPFQLLIPNLARGTNKISLLALFYVVPSVIYIVGALTLIQFIAIQAIHFILLNTFSIITSLVIILYLFKPVFKNIQPTVKKIFEKNKEYGFHIYIGQVADQSTAKLGDILIPYYVNTTSLGFYSLANSIISPMISLPSSASISLFKKFVKMKKIPFKIILYILGWLIFYIVIVYALGGLIVNILFGVAFTPVYYIAIPLTIGGVFKGLYQPYLMFMHAKEWGKGIRNASFTMGLTYVICDIILIPVLGVYGAVIADIIASLAFFIIIFMLYKKYLDNLKEI